MRRARWMIAVSAFAAVALGACHDWDGARDAFCSQDGAFCFDAGATGEDAGTDAGLDAGGGEDAGLDASEDAGLDAGVNDAGTDGGTPDASLPSFGVAEDLIPLFGKGEIAVNAVASPTEHLVLAGGFYSSGQGLKIDRTNVGITQMDDAFVAWLDRTGTNPASKVLVLTSGSNEEVTAVAAASPTDGYAVGTYVSALTVDGGTIPLTPGGGSRGGFVLRFDGQMKVAWARPLAESSTNTVIPKALVAAKGGPVVAVEFDGTTKIDGITYPAVPGSHGMIAKLNPDGGASIFDDWFECPGGGSGAPVVFLNAVDANAQDEILVAGSVTGSCNLHDMIGNMTGFSGNDPDEVAAYARLTSAGVVKNSIQPALSTAFSRFTSVASFSDFAVLGGEFNGSIDFGTTGSSAVVTAPSAFVLRVDANDAVDTFVPITADNGEVHSPRVIIREDGAVLAAGTFTGTLHVGSVSAAQVGTEPNVFILSLDPNDGTVRGFTSFAPGVPAADARLVSAMIEPPPLGYMVLSGRNAGTFDVDGQQVDGNPDGGLLGSWVMTLVP